jgi:hypothetical protein
VTTSIAIAPANLAIVKHLPKADNIILENDIPWFRVCQDTERQDTRTDVVVTKDIGSG